MIVGTCYFETLFDARAYYKAQWPFTTNKDVNNKIDNGEIHLGKPPLKQNEKLLLNTSEGRYFIETLS